MIVAYFDESGAHGLIMGLLAAMTNAAMANAIPATIQSQANARTRGLLGEGEGRYRLEARCGLRDAIVRIGRDLRPPDRQASPPSWFESSSLDASAADG